MQKPNRETELNFNAYFILIKKGIKNSILDLLNMKCQ